ncbi:MAG: hypothetical protein COA47_08085 [Robiginitomaculum sp.]|nr:MAG: hypothetical protein COA47_08085 [Robiginitomaculum sp.]
MTLESIYYIGQTVAVVAILASLAAVFIQMRQISKQTRQANRLARADLTLNVWMQTGATNLSMADTPEKADFLYRALIENEPLSGPERLRFRYVMAISLGSHEAGFNLHRRGLIEEATYFQMEALTSSYMQNPAARIWWRQYRVKRSDPAYIALIDRMVSEAEARADKTPGPKPAAPDEPEEPRV